MSFFDTLAQFPDDPIMNLPIVFAADQRPKKVNLGIGSYKDGEGKSYLLNCVKNAEKSLLTKEQSKDYLPIDGDPAYIRAAKELIFSSSLIASLTSCISTVQTVGGTSALRLGGEFLCQEVSKTVFLPKPTWPNHKLVFTSSGMKIHHYRYYDETTHRIDFAGMFQDISEMPPGSTILLHACCHNPTGMDLSPDQWKELSSLIKKQKIIPFFDCAYQGFKSSLDDDVFALRYFASQGHEMLVASSFAKNFGLYGERAGTLSLLTQHAESSLKASSQLRQMIRSNYSNPPRHGAAVIAEILNSDKLKKEWVTELGNMRERLAEMRRALISGLQAKGSNKDWSFLNRQSGFFSFLGLTEGQVHRLIKDYAVYMPSNGRINVAGLNGHNIDYVIEAILDVSQT